MITASNDKTKKVWDIHKKICIQTLISHYVKIFSLYIIDKIKFVSDGRNQDIFLWKYY
jgi:WD40 repeat protein